MKYPRYRVATCEGYLPEHGGGHRVGNQREPGLSATVCDTLYLWREIVTYRSEDSIWRNGVTRSRGRVDTLRDAEDHAAHLNEIHRRALAKERERKYYREKVARG